MQQKKILVCEDDADLRELISMILSLQNYQVIAVEYARDVYKILANQTPDLILLDLWLPDENGDIIIKKIRQDEKTRHIPVILFSADARIREIAEQAQADRYLTKPFEIEELEENVWALLN
ncbi:MAG: response regulator [Bacteroidia bacterium]|nr:response regulator [Bacteroidia bacterium]